MAAVIGAVFQFFATWLVTWTLLMVVYLGALTVVDQLRAGWRRYQRVRRYRRAVTAELMRIDAETIASVKRINAAFTVAQGLVRQETARGRGGHP